MHLPSSKLESKLEKLIIGSRDIGSKKGHGLKSQGFLVEKRSERFKSGKPDLRIGRSDLGQLDVELKYVRDDGKKLDDRPVDVGMTTIQRITLSDYNSHGMPAVCLAFIEKTEEFIMTLDNNIILCNPLRYNEQRVLAYLPRPTIIDGHQLFEKAKELINARYKRNS